MSRRVAVTPEKLVFLPGARGSAHFWRPVSDGLRHKAVRVHLGWPGFGEVPADPGVRGLDDLVDLVCREIDRPCALIAQSMGGVIALRAALRRPELVSHLVLAATSGGISNLGAQIEDWRPEFRRNYPSLPQWFADSRDDLSAEIPTLGMPTLLLWGERDAISPVAVGARLAAILPCARLTVVSGGDHDMAFALAGELAPLIDAHLGTA